MNYKKIYKLFLAIIMVYFNTVAVTAREKLIINDIIISGNTEIPEEFVTNIIKSKKGEELAFDKISSDWQMLNNHKYIEIAEIYPEIKEGKQNLIVKIVEKKNIYQLLKRDNIYTNSDKTKKNVPPMVKSITVINNSFLTSEEIIKEVPLKIGGYYSLDKALMGKDNILSMGYFQDVSMNTLILEDGMHISYTVTENFMIGEKISIKGNSVISTEELMKDIKIKTSSLFNRNTYSEDINEIMKKYNNKGYIGARVKEGLDLDSDGNITITIYEGIISEIEFKKYSFKFDKKASKKFSDTIPLYTKDYVLRRLSTLKKGELLTYGRLMETMMRIQRLGYFENIIPEIETDPTDPNKRNIIFYISEGKLGLEILGNLSFASNTGLIGTASLTHKNFLGTAESIEFSVTVDPNKNFKGELGFYDPWVKGTSSLSVGAKAYIANTAKSFAITANSATSKNKYTGNDHVSGFFAQAGIALIGDLRLDLKNDIHFLRHEETNHKLIDAYWENSITPLLVYYNVNNYIDPTDGIYAGISVTYDKRFEAHSYKYENFANKPDILSCEFEHRFYKKLFFDNNNLAFRLLLGSAIFIGGTDELRNQKGDTSLYDNKYELGGESQTVRGYTALTYRGMKSVILNLEDRITIFDNPFKLELGLFFDIGKVGNESLSSFLKFDNIKRSIGFALRLKNNLLPINLEWALPLDQKEDKSWQIAFSMRSAF